MPSLWFFFFTIFLHGLLRELRRQERGKMAPDGRREATPRRRPRACEGAGRWPPALERRACSSRPAGEPREHARALLRVRSRGSDRPVGLPTPAVCSALWRRDGEALGRGWGRKEPAPRRLPRRQPLRRDASVGPTLRGALVPDRRWGASRRPPQASPLLPVLLPLLCPAFPYSEPWLLFYLKTQCFLFSAVGWQRSSESTKRGFIYGKPGHPGNNDLFTRTSLSEEPGAVDLLRFFPRRERERMIVDRLPRAPHFLKVASFHPSSDPTAP